MAMSETYESSNVIKDAPQFTKWAEDLKTALIWFHLLYLKTNQGEFLMKPTLICFTI